MKNKEVDLYLLTCEKFKDILQELNKCRSIQNLYNTSSIMLFGRK